MRKCSRSSSGAAGSGRSQRTVASVRERNASSVPLSSGSLLLALHLVEARVDRRRASRTSRSAPCAVFSPMPRTPGDVVGRVAHQREDVDDLRRRDAEELHDARLVEEHAPSPGARRRRRSSFTSWKRSLSAEAISTRKPGLLRATAIDPMRSSASKPGSSTTARPSARQRRLASSICGTRSSGIACALRLVGRVHLVAERLLVPVEADGDGVGLARLASTSAACSGSRRRRSSAGRRDPSGRGSRRRRGRGSSRRR